MNKIHQITFAVIFANLTFLAGCSSSEAPGVKVSGVVTVAGKAVSGASLALFDREKGTGTTCELDDKGHFQSVNAIPPGKYLVTIIPLPSVHNPGDSGMPKIPKVPEYVPKIYQNANTSNFTVEVTLEKPNLDIQLNGKT